MDSDGTKVISMWEKIKKKVINFIYEEIEEEEFFEESNHLEKEKMMAREKRDEVKARVTFEYPKQQTANFRFPVIPDDDKDESANDHFETSNKKSESDENEPAYMRRTKRKRRRTLKPNVAPNFYEQKKLAKQLEEVPAYLRRNKQTVHQDMRSVDEEEKEHARLQTEDVLQGEMNYSTPDELDAVFKRIYEKTDETGRKQDDADDFTNDSDMHAETTEPAQKTGLHERKRLSEDDKGEDEKEEHNKQKPNTPFESGAETAAVREQRVAHEPIDLPHHLLDDPIRAEEKDHRWLKEQKRLLKQTLEHFNVDAEIVAITQGPTVTRFEIQPALGVKVSRIRNLQDDIKLNLAARDIRIEAPIPGKHTVGIEIPNKTPKVVHLQEMLEAKAFKEADSPLTVALGMTIEGEPYFTDIGKMPHGLIAGATGSGKSVCINAMILSLLYKADYNEVKLMLIDPKMVELTQYNGIPHLVTPVITDVKAATVALKWAVDEMERRYELFVMHNVRNIKSYNRKTAVEPMPYIVIIIDELADLMLVAPQEVEDYISRIAQKARAAGIHLILATQRPSVDVITGLIKANIPTRIAFAVSSQVDSRTILDANGAEKLLGKGDMLLIENGTNKQLRLQGPYVSDEEIERVAAYLRSKAEPNYLFEHDDLYIQMEDETEDELFDEVVEYILEEGKASTSMLQRRFRIGYNRAARLIDALYERGIISAQNGSKPRDVLITKAQWKGFE